ncbi:MAG: hypothetical protein VB027_10375 [Gordonibacter sp.]|nr:hypothetical protein [Gordonibacter sp.]
MSGKVVEVNTPESPYVAMYRTEVDLLGTKHCPYQYDCEAVHDPSRFLDEFAARMADEAVILAEMLLQARGEECTHETLNATMQEANLRRVANLRAMDDPGERLPVCVLDVMEDRREGGLS